MFRFYRSLRNVNRNVSYLNKKSSKIGKLDFFSIQQKNSIPFKTLSSSNFTTASNLSHHSFQQSLPDKFNEAKEEYNKENYNRSIEILEELISNDSKNNQFHFQKGKALMKLEKYDDAIQEFNQAILLCSDDVSADYWEALGDALCEAKRYEESAYSYQNAIDKDNNLNFHYKKSQSTPS